MELSSFGAIIEFAILREAEVKEILEEAMENEQLRDLHDLLGRMIADSRKSMKLLERTRRESINEMIIAPITGLNASDYDFERKAAARMSAPEFSRYVASILDRTIAFYEESAGKMPIEDARRALAQLGKRKTSLKASLCDFASE